MSQSLYRSRRRRRASWRLASTRTAILLLATAALLVQPARAVNGRPDSQAIDAASAAECALGALGDESLVTGLRIAAIFIIFASSSIGIIAPFLPQWAQGKGSRRRRLWDEIFFVLKYAGAGVIIATAFVHLTYESFVQLNSPCLNLAYAPLAPVLFMASLSLVFLVDCFLTRYIHRLRKTSNSSLEKRNDNIDRASSGIHVTAGQEELQLSSVKPVLALDGHVTTPSLTSQTNLDEKARELEVMIIEGGIVFHSVMVGLGLGTSPEDGFVPLFVAITFHQFFDGVAIGTRMALLNFVGKRRKQLAMFAAYGLVTPVGIAIGVGVRNTFQPNDPNTILAIGVLDSLSAGVLLYGALVNLLAKDFLAGEMLDVSNKRLSVALVSLFVGAALMSLLGQWA